MIYLNRASCFLAALLLCACASPGVNLETRPHVSRDPAPSASPASIPPPATRSFNLPTPKTSPKPETYSVVVNNVKVQDLLFALARDAKVNIDIHPGLSGNVTLNALDQTLPQLLTRISKQVDLRFEMDGPNLAVMPDAPYLRNYKIDYVNLARDTESSISVASQIGSGAGGSTSGNSGASNQAGGSGSSARIQNSSKNRFWDSLIQNVKDLLRETDKILPDGSSERTVLTDLQGSTTQQETRKNKTNGAVTKSGGSSMKDPVYKLIELTGTSTKSSDDAVVRAIRRAHQTLRQLSWFQVVDTRGNINKGKVQHWQVTIKVGFALKAGK